ncbi:hypothetical protein PAPHI01_2243 [Pancytospora philotis]|nr:hypothetical protein PAPHI01_2243 [Pancytospora philotis]
MFSRFVWMLPLLHCTPTSCGAAGIINGHALADYATFGALEATTLSALEGQTLDTLRPFCMVRDNPEVPKTIASASARWVAPRDKARCVVLSVLCGEDPSALLSQLMARTGFASHCLLAKIFHEDFVENLRSEAQTDTAMDDQFDKAIEKRIVKLGPVGEYITGYVLTATRVDFGNYVAQNGGRDTGFDFGVLGARMLAYKCVGMVAKFSKQIELWLAGASVSEKHLSIACEFTQVVLHSGTFVPTWARAYKTSVAELVARSPQNELLALFNAFHDSSSVQTRVTGILKNAGYCRIHPVFFLNYLKWLHEFSNGPKSATSVAWKRYLEDRYALSHVLQTCADPRSFMEEVPYLLLHESFTHLHAEKADISRRDEAARVIMKSLSCFTFTRVLVQDKLGKHHALMRFMLGNLDDDAKGTYLADVMHLKVDRNGNRSKKYMDIYRDVEAELVSHMSVNLSAENVPRAV